MSPNLLAPYREGSDDILHQISGEDQARGSADEKHLQSVSHAQVKRIACILCRRRKLKCDGIKPKCSTCNRLGHNCAYDEVRRKSGPKRGYVKALEERLKQVETQLKKQDIASDPSNNMATSISGISGASTAAPFVPTPSTQSNAFVTNFGASSGTGTENWRYHGESPQDTSGMAFSTNLDIDVTMGMDNDFPWELIGLGHEEPLPPEESINELHQIYFEKIHPSMPIIHKYRYLAAMNLAPHQRPPVALRYAMWCLAASVTDSYLDLRDHFYQRARKYMEVDALKGHGEQMTSVGHAQAYILLASYEFKMMHFPRAWMSTGAGVRMCQMLGLHRLDGAGLDVKECLPPPRDWTEKEERRRTFWMAFCEDRYASIGTGWPMTIDEADILTNLPASEEAYDMSEPEKTLSLSESFSASGASKLSPFAGIIVMACLFGKNLTHLHRPTADDRDDDLAGAFWQRHKNMDLLLLNVTLSLPAHLRLPNGMSNPNNIFTNMNIHTSTICLHQAALYKAAKNNLPSSASVESKMRCISAANEIASIMRMISHLDLSIMNPFIAFCLYVAARVFVQYLKSRPDDSQTGDSLRFLLSAMNALKKRNPLTESFLVQLDVDLEGLGMRHSQKATWGESSVLPSKNHCYFIPREEVSVVTLTPMTQPQDGQSTYEVSEYLPLPTHAGRDVPEGNQTETNHGGLRQESGAHYTAGDTNGRSYARNGRNMRASTGQSPGSSINSQPISSATTPSSSHTNLQSARNESGTHSIEAELLNRHISQPGAQSQSPMSAVFAAIPDYSTIPSTGGFDDSNASGTLVDNDDWTINMQQHSTASADVNGGMAGHLTGMSVVDSMGLWDAGAST